MTFLEQLKQWSIAEMLAAGFGLAYLLLAVRRNLWCWMCAFVSTGLYFIVFWRTSIYMQTALQVFYFVMAGVGFCDWKRGRTNDGDVAIRSWSLSQHVSAISAVLVVSTLNGWLLARGTHAVAPYLDSFVTWGSVVTTWMVARRVIENWIYWIVVDGAGAYLCYSQNLQPTTLLFAIYLGIVIRGYVVWRREQHVQVAETANEATDVAG